MRGVTQVPGYAGNLDVFQPALPMRGVTVTPLMVYLLD